jgi:Flp pilus assembly protein TadG
MPMVLPRLKRTYRRFVRSTRAVAAIEFAMIMPVLAVLFLGSFDGGRAIAIYMKVRSMTYAVDAITNQYTTIQSSDMQGILGATSQMLAPYSSTPVVVKISQITISAKGVATVSWGAALNGTPRAKGSSITVPAALATPGSYLIYGETSYTYTPMFGYFSSGNIALSDNLYAVPRSSTCIIYTAVSTTC